MTENKTIAHSEQKKENSFHWQMEYRKKPDLKFVNFAKKMLKEYPIIGEKADPLETELERGKFERTEKRTEVILSEVMIMGTSKRGDKGAVFFGMDKLVRLHYSYYGIVFSIPKNNILDYETQDTGWPQEITITEWAYENCYMKAINWILEAHGKDLYAMFRNYGGSNYNLKGSPYDSFINSIIKDHGENVVKINKINNNGDNNARHTIDGKIDRVFYVDGLGNLINNKKTRDKAHYSVYLIPEKKTDLPEKWKNYEDQISFSQAELKAIISALFIAKERKYESVTIKTDSKAVVNLYNNKWEGHDPEIVKLVKKMKELANTIPNLSIQEIPRDVNFACAI